MTDEELADAMRKLREFAVAQGMQWVLDEVDEAIALGVPESRTLRQTRNRQGQTSYEDVTEPELLAQLGPVEPPDQVQARGTRRSEEFTRSRPMTVREQTELLVQALGKVLADLDVIANGSLEALDPASLSEYEDSAAKTGFVTTQMPHIGAISFVPDTGSSAPAISIGVIRSSQRHARVAALLGEIKAEVDS
jgi:hypothetical protein